MTPFCSRLLRLLARHSGIVTDPAAAAALDGAETDHDGSVAIIGGQVHISEPTGAGRWPVLRPGVGVGVLVDGGRLTHPLVVNADHSIRLEVAPAPTVRSCRITVDDDAMTAYLDLGPAIAERWEILDHEPAPALTPRAARYEVQLPGPELKEVEAALTVQGVVHGIHTDTIRQALALPNAHTVVVARGTRPVTADPGRIELHIPTAEQGRPLSVEAGTVLAMRLPQQPGCPGLDVCGRALDPPARPRVELVAGPGTDLAREGQQIIAVLPGVPVVTVTDESMRIAITPQLVQTGNVGRTAEPLAYDGDILIEGWVEPGALVRATGRIQVLGGVQGATLEAADEVHILGGCIRSTVRQGADRALALAVQKQMQELVSEVARLHQATVQAINHPRYARVDSGNSLGPLVTLLVEHRFSRFTELLRLLAASVAGQPGELAARVSGLVAGVEQVVLGGGIRDPAELESWREAVTSTLVGLPAPGDQPTGRLVLYHLLHSRVQAAGCVEVTGPGAEHSEIHAGGTVKLNGHLRGGRVQAGGSVALGRVGAPAEIPTVVSVPADAIIQAEHCYPGTICEIGARAHRFADEAAGVTLRLDESGRVSIHYY